MNVTLLVLVLAAPFALARNYREVDFRTLRVEPESYRNHYVTYEAAYFGFSITFLPYMEQSGFKPDKHIIVLVGRLSLPVITKKTDEIKELLKGIKNGTMVRVYGKVRQFKARPLQTLYPGYYVELRELKPVQQDEAP